MDDTNWQPMRGSNPAAGGSGVDPNAPAEGDWRAKLTPEARSRIVSKIAEDLKKHLPVELVSQPYGLSELRKIAEKFEERIYAEATSQSDYLRKISLKILSMETKTKEARRNAQVVPNLNNSGQASVGSTSQIGHPDPGVGDYQEETYQMGRNQKMKRKAKFEAPQRKQSPIMGPITCINCSRLGHKYTNCDQPLKPFLQMRNSQHGGDIAEGDASYDPQATTAAVTQPKSSSSTTTPTTYATTTPRPAPFSATNPIPTASAPRTSPSAPADIRAPTRIGAFTSPRRTSPAPRSTTPAPQYANGANRRPSRYRRPSGKIKDYLTASNIDNMTVEDMKKM